MSTTSDLDAWLKVAGRHPAAVTLARAVVWDWVYSPGYHFLYTGTEVYELTSSGDFKYRLQLLQLGLPTYGLSSALDPVLEHMALPPQVIGGDPDAYRAVIAATRRGVNGYNYDPVGSVPRYYLAVDVTIRLGRELLAAWRTVS